MKQQRTILLIDDKDQSVVTKSIQLQLKDDYDLEFITIRTSAPELKKDGAEELDLNKLKEEIHHKIKNKHIFIALTDFDLESDECNGLDVVQMVHDIRPKVQFFIYSGNWDKVIGTIVGKDYAGATTEELVKGIKKLINNKIIDCIERTDYKDDLIRYLSKNNGDTIEHRLSTLLRAHGNLTFQSCFPEFNGLTFEEIADKIDNNSDARSEEWIDTILVQTIAYLVKVNQ